MDNALLNITETATNNVTYKPMNQPPGNPTENLAQVGPNNEAIRNYVDSKMPTEIETKLADLQAEVIAINESIKNQDHVIWLAKVEKIKQKSLFRGRFKGH